MDNMATNEMEPRWSPVPACSRSRLAVLLAKDQPDLEMVEQRRPAATGAGAIQPMKLGVPGRHNFGVATIDAKLRWLDRLLVEVVDAQEPAGHVAFTGEDGGKDRKRNGDNENV
jgi:hypothetical protein